MRSSGGGGILCDQYQGPSSQLSGYQDRGTHGKCFLRTSDLHLHQQEIVSTPHTRPHLGSADPHQPIPKYNGINKWFVTGSQSSLPDSGSSKSSAKVMEEG